MQVASLCHKLLSGTTHLKRLNTLAEVVTSALTFKTLSVTQIARKIKGKAQTKSNIRKVDRMLSNEKFLKDVDTICSTMNKHILHMPNPYLNIDGSKLLNSQFYTLRATLQVKGRGITVYELLYEEKEKGSFELYERFLKGLASVLPKHCTPILVTDAEFRVPWFKLVDQLGWDFIGRVRGKKNLLLEGESDFIAVEHFFKVDKLDKAKLLGHGQLNKTRGMKGYFYQYKATPKGRHAYTRSGRPSKTEKNDKYSKSNKEAWVLFSSLNRPARGIIKAYSQRMTIEENFRDTKSGRFGLGLNMTRSKQKKRYEMLLMIAMVVSTIAYFIGTLGEMNNLQYQFQANTVRDRRVLSRFFLGCEMVFREYSFRFRDIINVIQFCALEIKYDS